MKFRIYWAAPLHRTIDCSENLKYVQSLRHRGFAVFLPQEVGVTNEETSSIAQFYCRSDTHAVEVCDCVVAYFGDREPSDGQLIEIGMALGLHKPVICYAPFLEKHSLSLMVLHNCLFFTKDWLECEDYLCYLYGIKE